MTDIAADTSTTAHVSLGGSFVGSIETAGDHDWIAVNLTAGQKYSITLAGYGSNALEDPYLYLRDSSGNVLAEKDDINPGIERDSRVIFTPTSSGTYYIDAAAWDDDAGTYKYTGDYKVSVELYTPPPVYDYSQIADQLVNGYWGGDWHHFNVTQGGTITVNLTALAGDGQTLARAALAEWTDVIGVTFKEVTTGGQIVFDDSEDGAYTNADWANHVTTSATVNISSQWLTDYGTSLNTYSFQTYLHEIGHALGLGHAGNYNETATYPDDAVYSNDAWSTTVMSYFSERESSYFGDQDFSYAFTLTPMSGDILAMQTLYGLSTTTRTGNTTYGYGSNSGNPVFDTNANPDAAYTIIDSGGTDTLNYSASHSDQVINLNPGTFSNVAGSIGNMAIAFGTVIENAKGGTASDTIVGNAANNVLEGGAGNDTVSYEAARAGVTVDMRVSGQQNTIGAGRDTLTSFENLVGSAYGDTLTAAPTTLSIHGGSGDDRLSGLAANFYGDGGNDSFSATAANDWFSGGDGFDTIDYSHASGSVSMVTDAGNYNTGASGVDTLVSVERIIGSAFDDTLRSTAAGGALVGGTGNDSLTGSGGGGSDLTGGTGNDSYVVFSASDRIIERAGEGTENVSASSTYRLSANVENLTLTGTAAIDGTGSNDANLITGNSGANRISGSGGNDLLYGNAGNDTLDGGVGLDKMFGGVGNDIYVVRDATDYAYENAGEGTDRVISSISTQLRANVENLSLSGASNLTGKGNELANTLTGNTANNALYGYAGDDKLYGGDGNDVLNGGSGVDRLSGGTGNDTYYVDDATSYAYENAAEGTDRVYATVSLTLRANIENLTLSGASAINGSGNEIDNRIWGNGATNALHGAAGNDKLYGQAGDDTLSGDDGNDWLEGGTGKDVAYGGAGKDTFVFRDGDFAGATTGSADVIHDFVHGDDHIRLDYFDADTVLGGNQAFSFIGTAAFDGTAGELRYEAIGGATYVSGDTNGDGTADFMLRLDGNHPLTSGDFAL
ncbi:serralysin [Sphingomonas sp. F9_3S_D5_B_2]